MPVTIHDKKGKLLGEFDCYAEAVVDLNRTVENVEVVLSGPKGKCEGPVFAVLPYAVEVGKREMSYAQLMELLRHSHWAVIMGYDDGFVAGNVVAVKHNDMQHFDVTVHNLEGEAHILTRVCG